MFIKIAMFAASLYIQGIVLKTTRFFFMPQINIHKQKKTEKHLDISGKIWCNIAIKNQVKMICTPKVRRFWRCIFIWAKQEEKTIVQYLKSAL